MLHRIFLSYFLLAILLDHYDFRWRVDSLISLDAQSLILDEHLMTTFPDDTKLFKDVK